MNEQNEQEKKDRAEQIQSEISRFKATTAYNLIKGYLVRQIKRNDSVRNIDFTKPIEPQLQYAKGVVEISQRILSVIEHPERQPDVTGEENAAETKQQ